MSHFIANQPARRWRVVLAGLCLLTGCLGGVASGPHGGADGGSAGAPGGSGGMSPVDAPTSFTCVPTSKPPVDQLRALTTTQYQNTLADLTSWAMADAGAGAAMLTEVAAALAALPPNVPTVPSASMFTSVFPDGGWLRADQDIQVSRVAALYAIGVAVGQSLTNSARLGKVVGSCATDQDASNDAACLTSFIQRFGARALRRPLTSAEVSAYQAIYGSDPTANAAAYADVIAVMLNAPDALYFVEHGDAAVPGLTGVYQLDAYELASRLSYHVWDTLPDDELWQTAGDGSLLTADVYQKEVDRLFADPRARATMHRFFADYAQVNDSGGPRGTGGLNYHNLALRNADPQFSAFAGADLPSSSLGSDLVDDMLSMLDYYTWTAPGTVHDLLFSNLSFATHAEVAQIYGVPPWDGVSTPPTIPYARPGLFTRPLFLAAGLESAPILKGVYLRRYLLCDELGPPPAAIGSVTVEANTTETTRQATEALTSPPGCAVCHANWINPLGFASESFDGLGRFRAIETLFNSDGSQGQSLPVDTAVTPYVEMEDAKTTAAGIGDVMTLAEASKKPAACLARNYFRYTFGRFEDVAYDACSLEPVRRALDGGGHLIDMLKAVVQTPAFKQRTFQ